MGSSTVLNKTLFLVGLCLLRAFVTAQGNLQLVRDTCAKISRPYFCMVALLSDPRSLTADFAGLGKISLQLSAKNATATLTTITNMLKNQSLSDFAKSALTDCQRLYGEIIDDFYQALGKVYAKAHRDANLQVYDAQRKGEECEEGFDYRRYESPLTQLNEFTNFLAFLSSAFLQILQQQ